MRLPPLTRDQIPVAARAALEQGEALMGFMPNDALVMARQPALLNAFLELVRAVYGPGNVDPPLKRLIGMVASRRAGCHYCTAHTANGARTLGVPLAKLNALCDFANSALFSAAEVAALCIADGAAKVPNAVSDADYARLAQHYDAHQQVEIVAVISLFGFLNRWNATLDTELEDIPAASWRELD